MIALFAGYGIALGLTAWVLRPLFARGHRAPPAACPDCGARLALDARFCANCGTALNR